MSAITNELFQRLHLFMTEGQANEALATLEQISTSDLRQQREVAYLRAWCATLDGQWDAAAAFLLPADSIGPEGDGLQALGQTERRRRVHYLLLLGQTASELGYAEEAIRHYAQCLKFLDERRMNIPSVRIKARCGLGRAYTKTGFYTIALTHYEDALHLSGCDGTSPDDLAIYEGLCEVHHSLGNVEKALKYGEKALQLYAGQTQIQQQERMHHLLGDVCQQMRVFPQAAFHYTAALELATRINSPALILSNFTALATIQLEAGLLEEARHSYECALECLPSASDAHLAGRLYLVGGQIAEAGQAAGKQAGSWLDEAIACYRQAEAAFTSIQARAELADVYRRLAQLLETCGRQNEAIACWKSAYTAYALSEESQL